MFSLFFQVGPAVKLMMQEGRHITSDDFKELTPEQYKLLKHRKTKKERLFALCHNTIDSSVSIGKETMICTEEELSIFDDAWKYIEHLCKVSSSQPSTEEEKLLCAAKALPSVFVKGGPFEYVLDERKQV